MGNVGNSKSCPSAEGKPMAFPGSCGQAAGRREAAVRGLSMATDSASLSIVAASWRFRAACPATEILCRGFEPVTKMNGNGAGRHPLDLVLPVREGAGGVVARWPHGVFLSRTPTWGRTRARPGACSKEVAPALFAKAGEYQGLRARVHETGRRGCRVGSRRLPNIRRGQQ